ncbi:MAG: DUF1571 domain-containing protein [Planctomycetaceae bacterium]
MKPGPLGGGSPRSGRRWWVRVLAAGALGLAASGLIPLVRVDAGPSSEIVYYSTAAVPRDYEGPRPDRLLLAWNDATVGPDHVESRIDRNLIRAGNNEPKPEAPAHAPPEAEGASRVVSVAERSAATIKPAEPVHAASPPATASVAATDPIALAKRAILDCQARYAQVHDYTCTFLKRERINGRLMPQHIMAMKVRSRPLSVYFKFQTPNRGREAIYVAGRNSGKVVAHDVGIGKFLAGTMHLDPHGSMAMEDCRHPVTEAGIGALIDTVAKHWAVELTPEESVITFHPNIRVGNHPCTMIESDHPRHRPHFLFYKVKLYVDHEHGLPIRFEAYDWPKHPGAAPELIEEFTYLDLKTNVGLRDHDFDPSNKQYSFGRL